MRLISSRLTISLFFLIPASAAAQSSGDAADSASERTPEKAPVLIAVEGAVRTAAHIPAVVIDNSVAVSPNGDIYLALQTRPDPIIWMLPAAGEPFSLRSDWAAYRPRWAASGIRIGFIASIGPPRIWTVEVDPETGRAMDPPRMLIRINANAFAFSPDGGRVAIVSARSTAAGASEIFRVNWRDRGVRRLLRESGAIYWLDWSPDGRHIYYGVSPDSRPEDPNPAHILKRVRASGGQPETLMEVGEFLGLSPDGAQFLYRPVGGGGDVVEVSDLDGKNRLRFSLPAGPAPRWGVDPGTLVQVRRTWDGADILEIPIGPTQVERN